MISSNISIIDSSLKNGTSTNHLLVVKASKNNLTYSILDTSQNMFVALGSLNCPTTDDFSGFTDLIENHKENLSILKQNFGKTVVLLDTQVYTHTPDKLFLPDQAKNYLGFNHSFNSNENVHVDNISKISAKNIYWLPYDLEKFATKTLSDFEYKHITTILINAAFLSMTSQQQMLIHISEERFDIIVTFGNTMKFCNSFIFHTAQDVIYYLLNVYKQLELDPSTPLVLTGQIEQDSDEYRIIYKYIRNVSFAKMPEMYQYCNEIKKISQQTYFSLFNTFRCV
jgi:hypothetical protein